MDPILLAALMTGGGAAMGGVNYMGKKGQSDRDRAVRAESIRQSPWTGMEVSPFQTDPNLASEVLGGAMTGAELYDKNSNKIQKLAGPAAAGETTQMGVPPMALQDQPGYEDYNKQMSMGSESPNMSVGTPAASGLNLTSPQAQPVTTTKATMQGAYNMPRRKLTPWELMNQGQIYG